MRKPVQATKIFVDGVRADCGKCGRPLTDPEGSLIIDAHLAYHTCRYCRTQNVLPAWITAVTVSGPASVAKADK